MRRTGVAKVAGGLAFAVLAALLLAAGAAHAEGTPEGTTLPRALQFLGCAMGVATAPSPVGLFLVLASCLLLIAEP